jgi:hypothetical protein
VAVRAADGMLIGQWDERPLHVPTYLTEQTGLRGK